MIVSSHTFWIQKDLALYLTCGEIGDLSVEEMTDLDRMHADYIEEFGAGSFYVEVDHVEWRKCIFSRKLGQCMEVDYYVRNT